MFNKFAFFIVNKLLKGGDTMVIVCVTLIVNGYLTFARCPANLQPEIKAALLAMGLDENSNPIVV